MDKKTYARLKAMAHVGVDDTFVLIMPLTPEEIQWILVTIALQLESQIDNNPQVQTRHLEETSELIVQALDRFMRKE